MPGFNRTLAGNDGGSDPVAVFNYLQQFFPVIVS
jgi:hypothetical protein